MTGEGKKMAQHIFPANRSVEITLLALQAFQVLFLWIHDWIPLGPLNDIAAVRRPDTSQHLALATVIQSAPFSIGLVFSLLYFGRPYPHWFYNWLWITYSVLFLGQMRAWWIPYLFRAEPERAARYRLMFGNTHSFLPQRNGLVPNTAHVLLHLSTAATLTILLVK
jgi:hypothetical protein